ncbi:glutamine amidotransferase [Candidatus Uhrbacteria bacterium]|nr:glutamine amidotransferase [Candidatus Uhrbacteria bacterium]
MRPFLILQLRENDAAADGEFEAFLKYGGLSRNENVRIRMERDVLPAVDLDDYSGVLVGGGPWNVSDAPEKKETRQQEAEAWLTELLQRIVGQDVPFLGACYGLGALSIALGAPVSKERFGEAVGGITVEVTADGVDDPLLAGLPQTFRAFVGHKEACQSLPEGAAWLAKSSTCPVQMYRVGKNVYAAQFHPELDAEGLCMRTDVYRHAGYFPPEEADAIKALARQEKITEPMKILRAFVQRYRN